MARRYEDFLETLSPEEHEAVLSGEAFVGDPGDALPYVGAVLAGMADGEEARVRWMEKLASLKTQEEGAQIAAHLIALDQILDRMLGALKERCFELHCETCESCRAGREKDKAAKKRIKKSLDAAKAAFLEALGEEDEPWKAAEDDE